MKFLLVVLLIMKTYAFKEQWDVRIKQNDGVDVMQVSQYTNSEVVFEFMATSKTSAFKQAEEIYFKEQNKSLLVTRWYRGAHSEVIRIFDPHNKEKPLVKEIVTSWPASYEKMKNKLLFVIPVDQYDGSKPKNMKFEIDPFN